ncbi:MAG TPA: condensation domain-containing protein, partial [Trinickia sp.]|nr:condensation domain-containing protein [Trinickia sp.]
MVLFAAFEVLLFEQAGIARCTLGASSAGRFVRADEALVGNYVSVLPVAGEVDGAASFETLLKHVKAELLGVYSHAGHAPALPDANARANAGTPPLFLATFNMEPETLPPTFGDLRVELAPSPVAHVEFNLMMNVTETARRIVVDLDARADVLDASAAARWLDHYREILARIASFGGSWAPAPRQAALASL